MWGPVRSGHLWRRQGPTASFSLSLRIGIGKSPLTPTLSPRGEGDEAAALSSRVVQAVSLPLGRETE
jgi:hypothetical protein